MLSFTSFINYSSCILIAITEYFVAVSVLEYFQDPAVQEKVEEVGRFIYSNNSVTVNLSAVIAAGILALLGRSELVHLELVDDDNLDV